VYLQQQEHVQILVSHQLQQMQDLLLPPEHTTHGLNKLRHHSYSQHNLGVLQSRLMDAGLALKRQQDLLDALI